ncbi:MAG: LpxA family transferase, partial [Cyclobacteriaceae bacterium]|nr:LpxA family transferase [Cyclobacteriaceae bacterium]
MVRGDFIWKRFIQEFSSLLPDQSDLLPWHLTTDSVTIIEQLLQKLDDTFRIENGIAIHSTAQLESNVIIKSPVIIGPACFVAANSYLRGGVYLMGHNSIGPGVEIKSSFIFPHSNLAHFNFVGDSVIGSNVNFEAGAITANNFNERSDRRIEVIVNGNRIDTGVEK